MRILLIGGSGFIGPYVAGDLMRRGHDLTVFHRGSRSDVQGFLTAEALAKAVSPADARRKPRATPQEILGDRNRLIDHRDALRALAPDVVIDLILSSGRQARDLMDLLAGATERVVALSSADVYRACGVLHGFEPGPLEPLPLTETSALRTKHETYPPDRVRKLQQVFGWLDDDYDKIEVEREILGHGELPGTVLRLPMVYGPGDRLHRPFSIVKRIDDRRPAILFEERHGAWRAPLGYVENVAAAIAVAATSDRSAGRVYNVAEIDNLSQVEWATEVARVAGWSGDFMVLPADRAPAHVRLPGRYEQHWVVDSSRIRQELGYVEPIGRDEGIRRTIEWERANPPSIDPGAFDYAAEDSVISEFRFQISD